LTAYTIEHANSLDSRLGPRRRGSGPRPAQGALFDHSDAIKAKLGPGTAFVRSGEQGKISSDLVFITSQDFEIKNVVDALAPCLTGRSTVFHTSGSRSSQVLEPLRSSERHIGSFHPLVSITRPELGPERFRNAYFCVEGDSVAQACGRKVVEDLGGRPFSIDTRFKTLYHAAAVTACGHVVALFDAAVEMMSECGISKTEAKNILLPLVDSTISNLATQSNAAALTGTFARADTDTFTSHLATLNENVSDDLLEIYLLLGERSLELAARQGISHERIEMMRAKVAIAKSKLKW